MRLENDRGIVSKDRRVEYGDAHASSKHWVAREPRERVLDPLRRQVLHAPPHTLLPPVGDFAHVVAVVAVLHQLEAVLLIQYNIHREVHVGRTQTRGIESEQAYFEGVLHRIGTRQRALEDRFAEARCADDLVWSVGPDLDPVPLGIDEVQAMGRVARHLTTD